MKRFDTQLNFKTVKELIAYLTMDDADFLLTVKDGGVKPTNYMKKDIFNIPGETMDSRIKDITSTYNPTYKSWYITIYI